MSDDADAGAVLAALGSAAAGMSASKIMPVAKLSRARVDRALTSLQDEGRVEAVSARGPHGEYTRWRKPRRGRAGSVAAAVGVPFAPTGVDGAETPVVGVATADDPFAGMWIASPRLRVKELQDDVDLYNTLIGDGGDEEKASVLLTGKRAALKQAADEVERVAGRNPIDEAPVSYNITGVNLADLR